MSLRHSAFLFDYQSFMAAATSLMTAVDVGNLTPLQRRVDEISQQIRDEKSWILNDRGTFLERIDLGSTPVSRNDVIGYGFLIVLSAYLRPGTSLEFDWQKLASVLEYLKWGMEDRHLVLFGSPLTSLLKPLEKHRLTEVRLTDPYWYWICPAHSTYNGWLAVNDIKKLLNRLTETRWQISKESIAQVLLPPSVSTEGSRNSKELDPEYWYERIPAVYERSIQMMTQALKQNLGLYMIVEG